MTNPDLRFGENEIGYRTLNITYRIDVRRVTYGDDHIQLRCSLLSILYSIICISNLVP